MRELSLHVMDVTQNSIAAGATLIAVTVEEDTAAQRLTIAITDNGRGMTEDQAKNAADPFYTTRTTRSVGLGVPFFKMSSEMTGGSFSIDSTPGVGTTVTAGYLSGHIDMIPLGDMNETVLLLVVGNPDLDFVYSRSRNGVGFTLDTRELREILGGEVPLDSSDVSEWIRGYLAERERELL